MTEQELQAIRTIMKEELAPIKERLDKLEENQEEIRNGVNSLLDWSDKIGGSIEFPLPQLGA